MNYLKKIFFFIALDEDDDVLMAAMAVYNLTFTELEDLNHIRNLLVAHTKEREEHQKNKNFFEETVPLYSLSDFKSHFRMTRTTFENLSRSLGNDLNTPYSIVPVEKKFIYNIFTGNAHSYISTRIIKLTLSRV
ncbi:uncharacterized protein LOC127291234 isoform X1 [Leptopilina boulardi]|uniref:uncharacterized protein LOC127291234 isoform X1 n=1 Tax=Leptopilina boulardi TaxID=63433 RepID=UPI0021F59659|nr:uncharacterized protein LOC127291234 isoform X1 [Leptopilina boulardi]